MDTNEIIEKGVRLAKDEHYHDALKVFDQDISFTQNPTAMSYYALSLAAAEDNYERAIALCLIAAEKEFYNPDICLNLGRIFLMNGQKTYAIKSFKKGLKIDHSHEGLICELKKMGIRRKPVFPFLERRHPVNKFLGLLSQKIA